MVLCLWGQNSKNNERVIVVPNILEIIIIVSNEEKLDKKCNVEFVIIWQPTKETIFNLVSVVKVVITSSQVVLGNVKEVNWDNVESVATQPERFISSNQKSKNESDKESKDYKHISVFLWQMREREKARERECVCVCTRGRECAMTKIKRCQLWECCQGLQKII